MKKTISILLLLSLALSLAACGKSGAAEISCEEIIKAYEGAGYSNIYHRHSDDDYQVSGGEECYIIVYEAESSDSDLAEIKTFYTEEEAKKAADFDRYHIVKWVVAAMLGEGRWLKSGCYGRIAYSSYDSKLLKPLKELMK